MTMVFPWFGTGSAAGGKAAIFVSLCGRILLYALLWVAAWESGLRYSNRKQMMCV